MDAPCYCIVLRKASRRITALYDEALAPIGVNLAQFSLLRKIARKEPVSLTELGRLADLDRSTIGRNVRVLDRMGLTETRPGREDQREAMVALTAAGRKALEKGAPLWDSVQTRIEQRLGAENARQLETLLNAL